MFWDFTTEPIPILTEMPMPILMLLILLTVLKICFGAEADADDVNVDAEADAEVDADHIDGADANIVDNGALKCFATDHDTHLNQSHPFAS